MKFGTVVENYKLINLVSLSFSLSVSTSLSFSHFLRLSVCLSASACLSLPVCLCLCLSQGVPYYHVLLVSFALFSGEWVVRKVKFSVPIIPFVFDTVPFECTQEPFF